MPLQIAGYYLIYRTFKSIFVVFRNESLSEFKVLTWILRGLVVLELLSDRILIFFWFFPCVLSFWYNFSCRFSGCRIDNFSCIRVVSLSGFRVVIKVSHFFNVTASKYTVSRLPRLKRFPHDGIIFVTVV